MEYWVSKTDNGLSLFLDPRHHYENRSKFLKTIIPTFQYSIIPLCRTTVQPFLSGPAQRNSISFSDQERGTNDV